MNAASGMHYAAAEPGRYPNGADGPSDKGGVVEIQKFSRVLDMVAILEFGDADGALWTAADRAGFRSWTRQLLGWWVGPDGGQSVQVQNNIGTGYTVNALAMSFFLGETAMADHIVATQVIPPVPSSITLLRPYLAQRSHSPFPQVRERISAQIAPDGHLPLEDTHDPDSFGCKRRLPSV